MNAHHERVPSPVRDGNTDKTSNISSNLAKLKDIYGDVSDQKGDCSKERVHKRDGSGEEVFRLGGGSWK